MNKTHCYFVTGTNTEIGKTYIASLIAAAWRNHGLAVGVYKPVASDCRMESNKLVSDDAVKLWKAAGNPLTLEQVTPQRFQAATAPNVAARLEGTIVDRDLLRTGLQPWIDATPSFDVVLVEGVGGLMAPISDEDLVIDLAVELGFPLIFVVGNQLGCINHTLLSLRVAREAGLQIAGVYLNDCEALDESSDTNLEELQRLAEVPFIKRVHHGATSIDVSALPERVNRRDD